jgi:dynein heavy chain
LRITVVSHVQGNILGDEGLVDTLNQSKVASYQIAGKVTEADATERQIDESRELFWGVQAHA